MVRGEFDQRDDIEIWTKEYINRQALTDNVVFLSAIPSYAGVFDIIKPCLAGLILFHPSEEMTGPINQISFLSSWGVA
jgi:hypothetical protein